MSHLGLEIRVPRKSLRPAYTIANGVLSNVMVGELQNAFAFFEYVMRHRTDKHDPAAVSNAILWEKVLRKALTSQNKVEVVQLYFGAEKCNFPFEPTLYSTALCVRALKDLHDNDRALELFESVNKDSAAYKNAQALDHFSLLTTATLV